MAASEGGAPIHFFVTGFGRFQGVETNPTSVMVPRLFEHVKLNANLHRPPLSRVRLADIAVMETSTVGVDTALQKISSQVQMMDDGAATFVFLHFGVASAASAFCIESCGYNEASFRVPDERGLRLLGTPIVGTHPLSFAAPSQLPSAWLVEALQAAGHPVQFSVDPGRFLCNWCCYRSTTMANSLESGEGAVKPGTGRFYSLFVHVPSFETVGLDEQLSFATDLITHITHALDAPSPELWAATAPAAATVDAALSASKSGSVEDVAADNTEKGVVVAPATGRETDEETPRGGDGAELTSDSPLLAALQEFGFERAACQHAVGLVEGSGTGPTEFGARVTAAAELVIEFIETGRWRTIEESGARGTALRGASQVESQQGLASSAPSSSTAASSSSRSTAILATLHSKDCKMVVVVRSDLEMGRGKVAAQACHAALKAVRNLNRVPETAALVRHWERQGEPIVVLRCDGWEHLSALQGAAAAVGLPTAIIRDAGRTQVDPGTVTVLAIGPAAIVDIDSITGSLKLL